MHLDESIKVPIPEHKIAYKTVSGKKYVYYTVACYRNEQGKPMSDRVSIGKLDEKTGLLIPNRNYYEVYLKQTPPIKGGIHSYGVYYTFSKICEQLGITKILKRLFPECYKEILTMSQYMLTEGNTMYYLEDYTEEHETSLHGLMDDKKCSKIFASIRPEDVMLFFREWIKQKKSDEYIAYDITSISSYSKNIAECEWGYNRDKEKLPQINLGMYYGETSRLPLYYRVYPGSISDKTHLKYMVSDNDLIDVKRLRYVMDRGFYSADNLNYLVEKGHRFIIALPQSLNYVKDLISKHGNEIVNSSECMISKNLFAKYYETNALGFRMKVHLYYDSFKAATESESLFELIERQENDLKSMEEPPDKKYHYDRFFFINRSKDGKLGFRKNHKAIDEALKQCGFFLIAETDFKKSSKEILEIYRKRDVIEKSFDDLKNEIDIKRTHTQNSETLQGKIFTAFISLIVRSYMQTNLETLKNSKNFTQRKIFNELDKIKVLELTQNSKPQPLNPLTKIQRDILTALNLPEINSCMG